MEAAAKSAAGLFTFAENAGTADQSYHNPRCFLDLQIGGRRAGRLVVELFADVVPKTAENFRCLCTGERGLVRDSGKALHFRNTVFHRVIKGFMMQGGDFAAGNGTGGESIYGGKFEDESFAMMHNGAGVLSMANSGKNTNGSQFFITFRKAEHLDGKHVVFGRVVEGMELVHEIEKAETGANDRPLEPIVVARCGELELINVEVSETDDDEEAPVATGAAESAGGGATATAAPAGRKERLGKEDEERDRRRDRESSRKRHRRDEADERGGGKHKRSHKTSDKRDRSHKHHRSKHSSRRRSPSS